MLKVLLKNKLFVSLVDIVPGSGNYKQVSPHMHVPFRSRASAEQIRASQAARARRPRPPAPNVSPAPGDEPRPSSPSPRGRCAWSDGGPAPPPGQRPHGGRRQLARPERRAGLARARLRRARGGPGGGRGCRPRSRPRSRRSGLRQRGRRRPRAARLGAAAGAPPAPRPRARSARRRLWRFVPGPRSVSEATMRRLRRQAGESGAGESVTRDEGGAGGRARRARG